MFKYLSFGSFLLTSQFYLTFDSKDRATILKVIVLGFWCRPTVRCRVFGSQLGKFHRVRWAMHFWQMPLSAHPVPDVGIERRHLLKQAGESGASDFHSGGNEVE